MAYSIRGTRRKSSARACGCWATSRYSSGSRRNVRGVAYAEMHRSVAPEASLLPRVLPLVTHQLQERVVQELELAVARAQTGALERAAAHADNAASAPYPPGPAQARHMRSDALYTPEAPRHGASLVLHESTDGAAARLSPPGACVAYAVPGLFGDAALRAAALAHLSELVRGAPAFASHEHGVFSLAPHPRLSPLGVALWRLAAWNDSRLVGPSLRD